MKVQVLVADVRHPIEMAENPVRKSVAPRSEKDGADHDERKIGEDRDREGDGDMVTHAEFACDFGLAADPGAECSERANRDDLP